MHQKHFCYLFSALGSTENSGLDFSNEDEDPE